MLPVGSRRSVEPGQHPLRQKTSDRQGRGSRRGRCVEHEEAVVFVEQLEIVAESAVGADGLGADTAAGGAEVFAADSGYELGKGEDGVGAGFEALCSLPTERRFPFLSPAESGVRFHTMTELELAVELFVRGRQVVENAYSGEYPRTLKSKHERELGGTVLASPGTLPLTRVTYILSAA